MSKVAAIFDFDGTLAKGHAWAGFRNYYSEHRSKRRFLMSAFLVTHMPLWILSKSGLFSMERCMQKWAEDFSIIFKRASREEVQETCQWVVDNYVAPRFRSDIVDILNQHKQSGHVVMIVSGAFSNFLEIVGQSLGVSHVIGTKPTMVDGRYTGRVVKPACFNQNKVTLLKEYLSQNGLEIDFQSSFAYADSTFDIPLLELVGNPVATYPDENLRQIAIHNGWKILP